MCSGQDSPSATARSSAGTSARTSARTSATIEPRRSRPTRVRQKKARFSFDTNQIRSYDERLSKAKTNKKEKSAPMKDITNKLSDDLDANVRQMLSAHGEEKVPSVVTQGRAIFNADDPSKYSEKRKNEMVEVVGHGMDMMAKGILPNVPTPMRRQIMATALAKRNGKDQKELSKKAKKSKKPDEPELHHAQYAEGIVPRYAPMTELTSQMKHADDLFQ